MGILRAAAIRDRSIRALLGSLRQVAIRANMPSFVADPLSPTSYRNLVGWWTTDDPDTDLVLDSSNALSLSSAVVNDVVVTGGQADPFGGNNAFSIRENSAALPHYITLAFDFALQAGEVEVEFYVKRGSGTRNCMLGVTTADAYCIQPNIGFFSSTNSLNVFREIELESGWSRVRAIVTRTTVPSILIGLTSSANSTTIPSYLGDNTSDLIVYVSYVRQRRVSQQNDRSGNANIRTQVTAANRPFLVDDFLSLPDSETTLFGFQSSLSKLLNDSAGVASALSGTDQPFTWIGLMRWTGPVTGTVSSITVSGATAQHQIVSQSNRNLLFSRTDNGAVNANVTPDPVLSGFTADPNWHTVSVVFDGVSVSLWIDGRQNPTAIPLDVGACTFISSVVNLISRAVRDEALYSRALSSDERTNIEAGMRVRAQLTLDLESPLSIPGVWVWNEVNQRPLFFEEASVNSIVTAWTGTNLTIGSSGGWYTLQETVSGVTTHQATSPSLSNFAINGTARISFEARKPVGGRDWLAIANSNATSIQIINLTTGALGTTTNVSNIVVTQTGPDTVSVALDMNTLAQVSIAFYIANSSSSVSFAGDGRIAAEVRNVSLVQRRISFSQSSCANASEFINASVNGQPLYTTGVSGEYLSDTATVAGQPSFTQLDDSLKTLSASAAVSGVWTGTDVPGEVIGLGRTLGTPAASHDSIVFAGTGTARQQFVRRQNDGNVYTRRVDDAGTTVAVSFGAIGNTSAVYRNKFTGTQAEFYKDGIQLGATQNVNVGACTFNSSLNINLRRSSWFGYCITNRVVTSDEYSDIAAGFASRS